MPNKPLFPIPPRPEDDPGIGGHPFFFDEDFEPDEEDEDDA